MVFDGFSWFLDGFCGFIYRVLEDFWDENDAEIG